jgi:hypothetical protein
MASLTPFQPFTSTSGSQLITPSSASVAINIVGAGSVRICNQSPALPVWVAVASSAGSSAVAVTLPTSGAASNSFPIPALGVEKIAVGPSAWVALATSSGTSNPVVLTAGIGA